MTEVNTPQREPTPVSLLPQKRLLEEDHQPAISSPLNPELSKQKEDSPMVSLRAPRAKKESLKKREAKGPVDSPSIRGTPGPKASNSAYKSKKARAALRDQAATLTPTRWTLPMPRPSHYEAPRGPIFTPAPHITEAHGGNVQFCETSDHVRNKKGFHYTHSIADPLFRQLNFYRQSETEPFSPRFSFEDTAAQIHLDESATHITTEKGWRSAKANVGVREGKWYYECTITKGISKNGEPSSAHVRMGWGRREASNDEPVGRDAYSYAFRDVSAQRVHMARPTDFVANQDLCEGDVIGLEIHLPSEQLHRKVVSGNYNGAVDLDDALSEYQEAPNIVRERVPIHFKTHMLFEQYAYHPCKELEDLTNPAASAVPTDQPQQPSPTHPSPALRTLPHSYIKIYKNGRLLGKPFENLLAFLPPASKPIQANRPDLYAADDGMLGYFPMISVFAGGAAKINLGPDFLYPPPGYNNPHIDDDEVDMVGSDQPARKKKAKDRHTIRAVGDRYVEQIAEDVIYDIIDEAHFYQDAVLYGDGSDNSGTIPAAAGAASGEIRELVQDDE